jgi:hypothetical protein
MENKISGNVGRNLINCHLSILTFMWILLKNGFTREHELFMAGSYFENGNEQKKRWVTDVRIIEAMSYVFRSFVIHSRHVSLFLLIILYNLCPVN